MLCCEKRIVENELAQLRKEVAEIKTKLHSLLAAQQQSKQQGQQQIQQQQLKTQGSLKNQQQVPLSSELVSDAKATIRVDKRQWCMLPQQEEVPAVYFTRN